MAEVDKSFFGRLNKLFSQSVILRRGNRGLKVIDPNRMQSSGNLQTNRLVDRYNRLHSPTSAYSVYNPTDGYVALRMELFNDYEAMDTDPIISSALDVYSDESTTKDEYGDVLQITSSNQEIEKILRNLFYDVLNIEFNLWPWIRNTVKYGDFFLKLEITEKLGITNVIPLSSHSVIREEAMDPTRPEYVRFAIDPTQGGNIYTGLAQGSKEYIENYEMAHFRLLGDTNFLPYGKSMIEGARKTWKQLTLMEDAMLIHRIMRAPERRVFKIDIGNIPPNEVDNYMQQIINKMKKQPYIDEATGEYNLKFNIQNMLEDYYLPVRGGQSGTEIDSLAGMEFTGIEDIEYLRNKMMAALHVPKAFLGYEEAVEGKATLAAMDVRFSRTIERLQKIVISELTKIAVVHLYSQGYDNEQLVDFKLGLTNASTIAEVEKIELWSSKVSLARDMKDLNMISSGWIMENIFKFTPEDISKETEGVVNDFKQEFRAEQIKMEGNDPFKTQVALGTAHTLAAMAGEQAAAAAGGEVSESEKDLGGRPKEATKPGTANSARGRDPLGKETLHSDYKNRDRRTTENSMSHSSIVAETLSSLKETKLNSSLLSEDNILDDEKLK